jgi:hypothetical protein
MARGHFKKEEEALESPGEGFFHVITCACGKLVGGGLRRSPDEAKMATASAWGLHPWE